MHLLVTDQQVFLWTLLLTVPCLPKVAWPRKTLTLFQMIKSLIVSGAVVTAAALASPVSAGSVYVNPEFNTGIGTDSGVGGAILEGHIGYEFDNGAYMQVGPAALFPDDGEMEDIEISGKAGIGSGPLYGEVSFITGDETTVGVKVGSKFKF